MVNRILWEKRMSSDDQPNSATTRITEIVEQSRKSSTIIENGEENSIA
jgi:hypothetical protein